MALVRWQATVQSDNGNYVVNPSITVRNASDNSIATIYDDAGVAKANPFLGTSEGFVSFRANPGEYIVEGASGAQNAPNWYVTLSKWVDDAFASRSAFVAAVNWPWKSGDIVSDGAVQYKYIGTGSLISDLPGWEPYGLETPQHWGGGPGASADDNDAAFDSCAAWRGRVHVPIGIYQKNTPILFDRRPGTGVQSVYLGSLGGDTLNTKIVINTLAATPAIEINQKSGTTVEYGFRPVIENIGLEIAMGSHVNTDEADWCPAIRMRQCNNGLIRNVVHDGFDVGIDCQRVVQSQFNNITMRTALRSAANHAKAEFIFDHDRTLLAGTSFGNDVIDCEGQPTNSLTNIEHTFLLRAVDGLKVTGGHFNNAKFHVGIAPDGTGGRTTVRDFRATGVYFDSDNDDASPLVATVDVKSIKSGSVRIFGIQFLGCTFHTKEQHSANAFRFSGNAGDYAGLDSFRGLSFIGNEFLGFGGGSCINLTMHSSYDETTLLSEVIIRGNRFRDAGADASHDAANKNAIAARGKSVSIGGNTFTGNWIDAGNAVINISDDIDGYVIEGETFNTNRAAPILIDSLVTGVGQSFGHVINGAVASRVLGVVEEGTGANGYYCKYDNGRMVCLKKVSLTAVGITTADGTGFTTSAALSLGNVEKTFSAIPQWFVSPRAIGGFAMPNYGGAGTVSAPPSTKLSRFTSATLDVVVDIRADGTWS